MPMHSVLELRVRRLGIDTHQQAVAFMPRDCHVCRSEGFSALSRIELVKGTRRVIATLMVVDGRWVAGGEVGLSESAWRLLGAQEGESVAVHHPVPVESMSAVRGKIYGSALSREALTAIVNDIDAGRFSDVELAAFLTGCAGNQLSLTEIGYLTEAMVAVGERLRWDRPLVLDKHCVGGLPGNRTTPIVVAIVAANGLCMPKTSSRAITSPAGTADAMETLAPRELGSRSVGLVAPYLAYMRQDQRFHPGEAVSARLFAALLAPHIDWLVTVDPHLHRIHDLGTLYPLPQRVVHAAPALAAWIASEIARPLLIGPDSESEQWVSDVARLAKAPFVVLQKVRLGDRQVAVSVPDIERWREHTPVLIDDIISTGHTLLETAEQLQQAGMRPPVALAVHGVYAEHAQRELQAAGIQAFTSNSIAHASNAIDLSELLAQAIEELAPWRST